MVNKEAISKSWDRARTITKIMDCPIKVARTITTKLDPKDIAAIDNYDPSQFPMSAAYVALRYNLLEAWKALPQCPQKPIFRPLDRFIPRPSLGDPTKPPRAGAPQPESPKATIKAITELKKLCDTHYNGDYTTLIAFATTIAEITQ